MIALMQIPAMDLIAPTQGTAVLKAIAVEMGFECKCFDINLKTWDSLVDEGYGYLWDEWGVDFSYALNTDPEFHKMHQTTFDPDLCEKVKNVMLKHVDDVILQYYPRMIGICLFSIVQHVAGEIIVDYIREKYPHIELIVGGPALRHYDEESRPVSLLRKVDAFIVGDAEKSWAEYLKGNLLFPGINNISPDLKYDRDGFPPPDYSDHDLSKYPTNPLKPHKRTKGGTKTLYITASKGCIRRCEFCDVHKIWPNFYQREVESVIEEMKYQLTIHPDVKSWYFTDSLINGSNKFIYRLAERIIEEFGPKRFTWSGFWIVKSRKSFNEDYFKICAEAGLNQILVGIESGSEKVRKEMNKGYLTDDLKFQVEMSEKYGIKFISLMIVGYPTETDQDFEDTLSLVEYYKNYKNTVFCPSPSMMMLLPGTDVVINHDKYQLANITYGEANCAGYTPYDQQWSCGDNDYKKRIERYYRYIHSIIKYGLHRGYNKRKTIRSDYIELVGTPSKQMLEIMDYVDSTFK
jgi:hypothetical protein